MGALCQTDRVPSTVPTPPVSPPTPVDPPSGRLVLLRHGETEWSLSGRHTGRTDIPLTARGVKQAQALRPALAKTTFARVLSSPLRRARATCEAAGLAHLVTIEPDLTEWDY